MWRERFLIHSSSTEYSLPLELMWNVARAVSDTQQLHRVQSAFRVDVEVARAVSDTQQLHRVQSAFIRTSSQLLGLITPQKRCIDSTLLRVDWFRRESQVILVLPLHVSELSNY